MLSPQPCGFKVWRDGGRRWIEKKNLHLRPTAPWDTRLKQTQRLPHLEAHVQQAGRRSSEICWCLVGVPIGKIGLLMRR